jgi:hypothetical protein
VSVPFCPECHASYEPGVVLCRNCRVELVDVLAPAEDGDPFVSLRDVPDAVTAAMWQGALESQGIHVVVHSNALPAYGQVLRDWSAQAWGTLRVPRAEYDEAAAVLADFLATAAEKAPAEDEDVPPAET